jgi:hypothetical protein
MTKHPDDIEKAHRHSSNHRAEVLQSSRCGCFYCGAVFPPEEIVEWVDEVNGEAETAVCPRCGIDSVIGDQSGFPLTAAFLERMKAHWFSPYSG